MQVLHLLGNHRRSSRRHGRQPPVLGPLWHLGRHGRQPWRRHARSLRVSDSTPEPGILAHPCRRSQNTRVHHGYPCSKWVQVQIPPGAHYFLSHSLTYESHEVAQFSATTGDIILYVWANRETGPTFNANGEMSPKRWYKMLLRVKWINTVIEDGNVHQDSDDEMT